MFRLEDMKKYIILSLLCGCLSVNAQTMVPLTYRQYMERVAEGNLEYASEKLNVPSAKAEVTAAKVFNDPNLSVSYFNNENNSLQMGEGVEVELSKTFSFGKRGANISLARSESELTEALLADYFRNLRADATIAYMEALKQHELYKVKENAYENIRTLAESDSIRFSLGQIREVDATQSRVEAGVLRNELLQAGAELKNAFSNLNFLTGTFSTDTLFHPEAELRTEPRDFILADLITAASEGRTDLVAALKNKEVAARALKVARRERNTDVDLSIAVSRNARVYKQALLQVQTEVMQAYRNYQSFAEQVNHYEDGLLRQAREVMDGKIYSYNRGEVSLLEVLDAQRTYDEVQAQYIETLFNYSSALVELERSAGIWDIEI